MPARTQCRGLPFLIQAIYIGEFHSVQQDIYDKAEYFQLKCPFEGFFAPRFLFSSC